MFYQSRAGIVIVFNSYGSALTPDLITTDLAPHKGQHGVGGCARATARPQAPAGCSPVEGIRQREEGILLDLRRSQGGATPLTIVHSSRSQAVCHDIGHPPPLLIRIGASSHSLIMTCMKLYKQIMVNMEHCPALPEVKLSMSVNISTFYISGPFVQCV